MSDEKNNDNPIDNMDIDFKTKRTKSEAEVIKEYMEGKYDDVSAAVDAVSAAADAVSDMDIDFSTTQIGSAQEATDAYLAGEYDSDTDSIPETTPPSSEAPPPPPADSPAQSEVEAEAEATPDTPLGPPEEKIAMVALNDLNTLVITPDLIVKMQIDVNNLAVQNDEVILTQDEGAYKRTHIVGEQSVIDTDWIHLYYFGVPKTGHYTLIYDPKDNLTPYIIFEKIPYDQLVELNSDIDDLEIIEPPAEEEGEAQENNENNTQPNNTETAQVS